MRDSINNNKLTGDYQIAFLDILSYIQSSNISTNSKFSIEVGEDIKDMLLSAQKDELPVNNIIGKDIKSFCEDIVQSHNTKKVKLLEILKRLNFYLGLSVLIVLLFQVFHGYINLSIIIMFFLTWFLYKYIQNFLYKKLCLKFKGLKNKIKCLLLIYLVSIVGLFPVTLLIVQYCNLLINVYYIIAICLLFILIIHIICKKLDKNIRWYSYLRQLY